MNECYVAIIDIGLGNLFSVQQACEQNGLHAVVTSSPRDIAESSGIIVTGVGAFEQAITRLKDKNLVALLHEEAISGKPFLGICLGMQLLMTTSEEFGFHEGLNIIPGNVVRLGEAITDEYSAKVPHVGWSPINRTNGISDDSLLQGLPNSVPMYFVHSYYVKLADTKQSLTTSTHGNNTFCSSCKMNNITGVQFHPECSGIFGLQIYKNFAVQIQQYYEGEVYV